MKDMGLSEIPRERMLIRRERGQGTNPRAFQLLEVRYVFFSSGYIYNNNFMLYLWSSTFQFTASVPKPGST